MADSSKKRAPVNSSAQSLGRRSGDKPARKRPGTKPRETKQSRAIALLRSAKGATIDALMKATGWQQHSVRGFLAGVVRKRLRLELESMIVDGRRVYRVLGGVGHTGRGAQTASADEQKQQQA